MKQILLAFIISISLHLLAIYLLKDKKTPQQSPSSPKSNTIKQSNIKFVRLKQQPVMQKIIPKPVSKKSIKKPPKKKGLKKLKKYTPVKKAIKKSKRKVVKKPLPKKEPKTLIKVETKKKPVSYEKLNPTKLQKDLLEKYMSQPLLRMDQLDSMTRKSLELYKDEYENLTKVQKVFLQNNLRKFQIITQRVLNRLGYPRMAVKRKLSGTNVVEFMFHPDGSISKLNIINSSGYAVFDSYTLELIEIAYKDYPRPKESTKIRFNVEYSYYGY